MGVAGGTGDVVVVQEGLHELKAPSGPVEGRSGVVAQIMGRAGVGDAAAVQGLPRGRLERSPVCRQKLALYVPKSVRRSRHHLSALIKAPAFKLAGGLGEGAGLETAGRERVAELAIQALGLVDALPVGGGFQLVTGLAV